VALDVCERFSPLPLYGAMGGFHLSGANEVVIGETVSALAKLEPGLLIPGHCTGWRALSALGQRMGDQRVVPSAVGRRYVLEAHA
jgi:7,8-dihydropterin-6-yl-methyl-4-(beta-D-ribofuranosyl)aminobenzene 5'-phosphate synthase